MAKLELVGGVPRMRAEDASPVIYDETLEVVASGAGAGQINGPISGGTPVTLPNSKTYTGNEIEIYVDGGRLTPVFDYTFASSTTVSFTFTLKIADTVRFRIDRSA